jgi:GT2 family glycosyltransferase
VTDALAAIDLGAGKVGETLLGPVYAEFFTRLHAYLRPHDENVKRLFVARAGVRLQHLYQVYCRSRGIEPAPSEILWTSRLLAAKALYGHDDKAFHRAVRREFKNESIESFARAISRHGAPLRLGPLRRQPIGRLEGLLKRGRMPRLHAYLTSEAATAHAYLTQALGGATDTVFLVDSGWHGTIHRLLQPLTDADLVSLFVARVMRQGEAVPPANQVIGLLLDSDRFRSDRPESALIFHRHLIEAPLEPPSPSIARAVRAPDGGVTFPEARGSDEVDSDQVKDQIYLGVLDYLSNHGGLRLSEIQSAFVSAIDRLSSSILFPRDEDVASLDMGRRSSDFGRDYSAPVIMPPVPRRHGDTAETRVRESLWPQGQAVVEFGEQAARNIHRNLAGTLSEEDYFHPWKRRRREEPTGTVAVVTRTKDRPILLGRAADSVALQRYPDVRWVIVNDGGDVEPVLDVVRACPISRAAITIVTNDTSVGMESASNLGISAVESDFIAIHDDDDSWHPGFLEETVSFLRERADDYVGVVTHATYVSEEIVAGEVKVHAKRPHTPNLRSINLAEMSGGNQFAPIAFLFTRDVYEAVGGFPEHLPVLGDWDFNLRVLAKGDIGVLQKPLAFYHHRDRGTSIGYGNSVIGGRDKHIEFEAKVRNEYLRTMGADGGLGQASLIGYAIKTLREEIRRNRPVAAAVSRGSNSMDPDLLWWALAASLAVPARGRGVREALKERLRPPAPARRVLSDDLVERLTETLHPRLVPCPSDFDEQAYLAANPDVRKAVTDPSHALTSGWEHYLSRGKQEKRPRANRGGRR